MKLHPPSLSDAMKVSQKSSLVNWIVYTTVRQKNENSRRHAYDYAINPMQAFPSISPFTIGVLPQASEH
jgi:hypothetical protein